MLRGGLARRVALLERLRREALCGPAGAVPTLTIIGADEFLPDRPFPSPDKTGSAGPAAVRAAYDRLKADAGCLSPAAAAWFGTAFPGGFTPVESEPVTRRFEVTLPTGEKRRVIVIFFPAMTVSGTAETECPTPALVKAVLDAADTAVAEALAGPDAAAASPFVIGVSPWGFQAERAALPALSRNFHVLLGAGAGAPLVAEAPDVAPSVLWSRADMDGRGLVILDILRLPAAGGKVPEKAERSAWDPVTSARAREIAITPSIDADAETALLLR